MIYSLNKVSCFISYIFDILENFLEQFLLYYEEFEDTKEVIRIHKSKDKQHNGQTDKESGPKRQTKVYKTLHRKTKE